MIISLWLIFSYGFSKFLKIKQLFGSWWAVASQGFYSFLYQTTSIGWVVSGTSAKAFTQNYVPVEHCVWGWFPENYLNTFWIPLFWDGSTKWFPRGERKNVGSLIGGLWGGSGRQTDYFISFVVPCYSVTLFLKLVLLILRWKWLILAGINWVILRSTWKHECLTGRLCKLPISFYFSILE